MTFAIPRSEVEPLPMSPQRVSTIPFCVLVALLVGAYATDARADEEPPRLTHVKVEKVVRGTPLTVSATITDESEIFAPTLYFRSPGEEAFDSVILQRNGDVFSAQIPVTGDVQYWLEAYDEYGNGPSRSGAPGSPHLVVVVDSEAAASAPVSDATPAAATKPAPPTASVDPATLDLDALVAPPEDAFLLPAEPKPAYKQWWFITGAGVLGAAAAGVLVYALRPDDVHRNTFGASVTRP